MKSKTVRLTDNPRVITSSVTLPQKSKSQDAMGFFLGAKCSGKSTHVTQKNNNKPQRVTFTPEFYPMPRRGPDVHFGICRTMYYEMEQAGLIRIVRLRTQGNTRGKLLISAQEIRALILTFQKSKKGRAPLRDDLPTQNPVQEEAP